MTRMSSGSHRVSSSATVESFFLRIRLNLYSYERFDWCIAQKGLILINVDHAICHEMSVHYRLFTLIIIFSVLALLKSKDTIENDLLLFFS